MTARWIATLMLLAPGLAQASAIHLQAADGTCHLNITLGQPTGVFTILADATSSCGCVDGAEFRVAGLGSGWVVTVSASPGAALTIGDPLGGGCNIALSTCSTPGPVLLYTIGLTYVAGGDPPATTLRVEAHSIPSYPTFPCPVVTGDTGIIFCKECATGGVLYINNPGDCTVGTRAATWSQVKALLR